MSNSKYGLYVGGYYNNPTSEFNNQYVAKYNSNTNSFESILNGLKQKSDKNSTINAMTVYNGKLYVAGFYNHTSSSPNNQYVAKYNSNTNSFESILNGLEQKSDKTSNIYAMNVFEGELYVGGFYDNPTSDINNQYVAKYNSNTNSFESILNGLEQKSDKDSNIYAMTVYNGKLYVAGYYDNPTSEFNNQYVAKYNSNTNSFESILNGLEQKSDKTSILYAMTVFEGKLYVAGYYDNPTSEFNNQYVAKYNSNTNSFESILNGLEQKSDKDATIFAMTVYNGKLYVGGFYDNPTSEFNNQYVGKI